MALTDKLTAIGNAIRAKTGGTDLIPLADMPAAIESIPSGGGASDSVTLTITGRGNESYCYLQIGDTKYYSPQTVADILVGTLIYCYGSSIYYEGENVSSDEYYYVIPKNTNIELLSRSSSANSIHIAV